MDPIIPTPEYPTDMHIDLFSQSTTIHPDDLLQLTQGKNGNETSFAVDTGINLTAVHEAGHPETQALMKILSNIKKLSDTHPEFRSGILHITFDVFCNLDRCVNSHLNDGEDSAVRAILEINNNFNDRNTLLLTYVVNNWPLFKKLLGKIDEMPMVFDLLRKKNYADASKMLTSCILIPVYKSEHFPTGAQQTILKEKMKGKHQCTDDEYIFQLVAHEESSASTKKLEYNFFAQKSFINNIFKKMEALGFCSSQLFDALATSTLPEVTLDPLAALFLPTL